MQRFTTVQFQEYSEQSFQSPNTRRNWKIHAKWGKRIESELDHIKYASILQEQITYLSNLKHEL